MKKMMAVMLLLIFIGACSTVAPLFTPQKQASDTETDLAKQANRYFWDNYHQGNYDSIPQIIRRLNVALQENAKDLKITAHLGFAHIWALSERQNREVADPTITEHIHLSKRYFEEANAMNPHDPRILGFLADLNLVEGSHLQNEKQQTKGYFLGLESIKMWPEFNKFTLGYVFSNLDKSDKLFKKAMTWQYETLDDCVCGKNAKKMGIKTIVAEIKQSKNNKIKRACWNSWIAPHNWEGFFLNWGDMLIKNGEIEEGIRIYNIAKESDTYEEWPYKSELEARIKEAVVNMVEFNKPISNQDLHTQKVMMFNSKMSCMGCHQMSKKEFTQLGYQEPTNEYYFVKK